MIKGTIKATFNPMIYPMHQCTMSDEQFCSLVFGAKAGKLAVKPDNKNYSFHVKTLEQINFSEVTKDVTHTNPVALVKVDGKTFAAVHDSYIRKYQYSAYNGKIPIMEDLIESDTVYNGCTVILLEGPVSELIEALRTVKEARWTSTPVKNSKVEVIFPKV